jgi:hypothetical protein
VEAGVIEPKLARRRIREGDADRMHAHGWLVIGSCG